MALDGAKLDACLDRMDALKARADGPFQTLERKLAHKSGVSDPAAVAAKIGREKLGQAEMTRRSVEGRK